LLADGILAAREREDVRRVPLAAQNNIFIPPASGKVNLGL
jgi:hypothetical protein